jgi:hypothetical protein
MRLALRAHKSTVLLMLNVKVRLETQRFISLLESSWDFMGKL